MKIIIKYIKRLIGIYETGCEYWVNIKDIHVDPKWRKTQISRDEFSRKMKYWHRTGEFKFRIILDKNFNLIDGYSSFRIAEFYSIKKVPVYFVN